jgi:hypothetical protein
MSATRLSALAVIAALSVFVFVFYRFGFNDPDPASLRATLLVTEKAACFKDARADSRNVTIPDAKLTAFCGCVVDRSVGALTDADLQTATGGSSLADRMPMKLAAANRACKGELVN